MELVDYIGLNAQRVDSYLNILFAKELLNAKKIDPLATQALISLRDFCFGGKKVRGSLTILGYELARGKKIEKILPTASAVEIMHSSLLIHDDFIDHDRFRRGKPTIHEVYAKRKDAHYGASMALVIGDVGIFLSNQVLSESDFSDCLKVKAASEFQKLLIDTGYGELMDIDFDTKEVSWKDLIKVRIYKTARYTFVMPLKIGAILAGAKGSVLKAIQGYGDPLGVAFQIKDDILGVFGVPQKTGKSDESDIKDGKRTLLFAKTKEFLKGKNLAFFDKWYGSEDLDRARMQEIKKLIRVSGALDYCQEYARSLVKNGKRAIPRITKEKKCQTLLSEFADFIINRES